MIKKTCLITIFALTLLSFLGCEEIITNINDLNQEDRELTIFSTVHLLYNYGLAAALACDNVTDDSYQCTMECDASSCSGNVVGPNGGTITIAGPVSLTQQSISLSLQVGFDNFSISYDGFTVNIPGGEATLSGTNEEDSQSMVLTIAGNLIIHNDLGEFNCDINATVNNEDNIVGTFCGTEIDLDLPDED